MKVLCGTAGDVITALIVFAAVASAQQTAKVSDADKALADAVSRPVLYQLRGTDDVRVRKNVVYKREATTHLMADFYMPRETGKAPIVIFIHGGVPPDIPVKPKDWGIYQSWGRLVAASGFIGITFNHRLGFPEPHLREAASDLDAIIRYVRANAPQLHADGDRICLAAFSAGGPLLSPALRDRPPYIRCIVSMYNFLDITRTLEHPKFETPDVLKDFSPVTHLRPDIAPMLVVRAGKDQIPKLNESIATFVQRAVEVNAPITLMIHPTGPHGFDNQTDD
ncbi:MAG TPA: alpha/beta hydrolase, partial [Thermoanaerobaculia bacterium]|nr:alpha/beta hydrolase [Thermoanaerobaculia bacterium]